MLNRSFVLSVLIASATLVCAQESQPSGNSGPSGSSTTSSGSADSTASGTDPTGSGSSPTSTGTGSTSNPLFGTQGGAGGGPVRSGTGSSFDRSFDQGFNQGGADRASQSGSSTTPTATAPAEPEKPSFTLPGGYGAAPQTVTPGEGTFARPPLAFSTTIQQGYNDNIYSTSGLPFPAPVSSATTSVVTQGPFTVYQYYPQRTGTSTPNNPVQGSLVTQASLGAQVLLVGTRAVLSLEMSGGGLYYWDRRGNSLDPNGNVSLMLAYKLNPRAQFSATVSGAYLTQPNLNLVNAPTQGNVGNYIMGSGRFDLSYQLTGRISTDFTINLGSLYYLTAASQENDYMDTTFGTTIRYSLTPRFAVAADLRMAQTSFQGPNRDSATQFFLGGFDYNFSQRFTGSIRAGETTREYQNATIADASSPFLEANFTYGYGRASQVDWTTRYGFENGVTNGSSSSQTFRTTLGVTQAFSTKFSANASVGYSNSVQTYFPTSVGGLATQLTQNTLTFSVGAQYIYSRSFTFFGNVTRSEVLSTPLLTYSTDTIFLGALYHF